MIVLSQTTPVAKKAYRCDAVDFVLDAIGSINFTILELREIVKARRNKYKILPGQKYLKQVQVDQRALGVFRAIPEIDAICVKYELYPEW